MSYTALGDGGQEGVRPRSMPDIRNGRPNGKKAGRGMVRGGRHRRHRVDVGGTMVAGPCRLPDVRSVRYTHLRPFTAVPFRLRLQSIIVTPKPTSGRASPSSYRFDHSPNVAHFLRLLDPFKAAHLHPHCSLPCQSTVSPIAYTHLRPCIVVLL